MNRNAATKQTNETFKVKCLLVDDLEENLVALRALLADENVELYSARSGVDALELMLQHDFGLALVDVQMPSMDGFELAELMRGSERTRSTPIIFLTAGAWNRERIFKGYESGAVDFMFKPIEPRILRSKVRVFVELNRQKMALAEAITAQKQAAEDLLRAKQEAEAANVLKSEFLANMSHEIRTPMTAILGFAELLLSEKLGEQARLDFASRIRSNGDHLLHLIDDILDLSKFEAGRVPTEKIDFSLWETVADALRSVRPLAERKGLDLRFEIEGQVPKVINSDPHRLRQIVLNLVGNAIKFTSAGYVRVVTRFNDNCLTLDVEDTGIGLSPEQSSRLFRAFQQADSSVTRKFGGTGLGLALSKRIAEALGGSLSLSGSVPGKGSVFTLRIKAPANLSAGFIETTEPTLKTQAPVAAPSPNEKVLDGVNVLLVEDSVDNEALMKLYLETVGAKITCAHNGREAIEAATSASFDVILMDVQMPDMDGLEATRRLRARGDSTPIIALTAHALPEEIEKSIAAGCDQHVTKPVGKSDLIQAIEHALSSHGEILRRTEAEEDRPRQLH